MIRRQQSRCCDHAGDALLAAAYFSRRLSVEQIRARARQEFQSLFVFFFFFFGWVLVSSHQCNRSEDGFHIQGAGALLWRCVPGLALRLTVAGGSINRSQSLLLRLSWFGALRNMVPWLSAVEALYPSLRGWVLCRVEFHGSTMGSPRGVSSAWRNSFTHVSSIRSNWSSSLLHASLGQAVVDADWHCDIVHKLFGSVLLSEFVLDFVSRPVVECDHLRSILQVQS